MLSVTHRGFAPGGRDSRHHQLQGTSTLPSQHHRAAVPTHPGPLATSSRPALGDSLRVPTSSSSNVRGGCETDPACSEEAGRRSSSLASRVSAPCVATDSFHHEGHTQLGPTFHRPSVLNSCVYALPRSATATKTQMGQLVRNLGFSCCRASVFL